VFRFLPALMLLASLRPAFALTAADVGDEVQRLSLDPAECYRVLDLNFSKEDIKVYLASGYPRACGRRQLHLFLRQHVPAERHEAIEHDARQ
jgi:hypothetical protein